MAKPNHLIIVSLHKDDDFYCLVLDLNPGGQPLWPEWELQAKGGDQLAPLKQGFDKFTGNNDEDDYDDDNDDDADCGDDANSGDDVDDEKDNAGDV